MDDYGSEFDGFGCLAGAIIMFALCALLTFCA